MTRRTRTLSLGALAVTLVLALTACADEPAAPSTAAVERGTVATRVSASGALASIRTQNLGFPKGAQLKELNVKVGDQVRPGQVLARLDTFFFQQTLNQQQAQLLNQQAQLNRLTNGNTVEQAERSLSQARDIRSATKRNADAVNNANESATGQARKQFEFAKKRYDEVYTNNPTNRSGCTAAGTPNGALASGGAPSAPGSPNLLGGLGGSGGSGSGSGSAPGNAAPAPPTPLADCPAVATAKQNLLTAKTNLDAAQETERVGRTQGKLSVENAQQGVVTAQNDRDTAGNDAPANIEAQRALVANARAMVALARRDLDNTVLYAPLAGTVTVINGAVGEFLGAQSGTTALAPGTSAAIPGVGASATSGDTIVSTDGNRNGGTFITLGNVNTYQVVVPFEESDAARVAPNQLVEVSFDAVPDLVRNGRVLSIAPSGTDLSGVTNYYATIVLTESDPRLRDGQTAEAAVLTTSKSDVLTVPNNAVSSVGGRSFVMLVGADGVPVQTPFEPGMVGDDRTEVLSGLIEGQRVQLPQATVTATPDDSGGGGGPR